LGPGDDAFGVGAEFLGILEFGQRVGRGAALAAELLGGCGHHHEQGFLEGHGHHELSGAVGEERRGLLVLNATGEGYGARQGGREESDHAEFS